MLVLFSPGYGLIHEWVVIICLVEHNLSSSVCWPQTSFSVSVQRQNPIRPTRKSPRGNRYSSSCCPVNISYVPFIISRSGSFVDLHFAFRVSRSPKRLSRMALAIGSIMAVVAVLLSHMDKKDVVNIIPSMSLGKQFNPHIQISNSNRFHGYWLHGIRSTLGYRDVVITYSIFTPKPTICLGNPCPVCDSQSQT